MDVARNHIYPSNFLDIVLLDGNRPDFGWDLHVHDISVHDNDLGLRTDGTSVYWNFAKVCGTSPRSSRRTMPPSPPTGTTPTTRPRCTFGLPRTASSAN